MEKCSQNLNVAIKFKPVLHIVFPFSCQLNFQLAEFTNEQEKIEADLCLKQLQGSLLQIWKRKSMCSKCFDKISMEEYRKNPYSQHKNKHKISLLHRKSPCI